MKKKSDPLLQNGHEERGDKKRTPALILTSFCSLLSIVLITLQWDRFRSGWRLESLEHFIASLYLIFLTLSPFALILLRKLRSHQGKKFFINQFLKGEIRRKKLTIASIITIFALFSCALLSPIISPRDPNDQPDTLVLRYLPPFSSVSVILKSDGSKIYANEIRVEEEKIFYRRGPIWTSIDKKVLSGQGQESWKEKEFFILGTDKFGRDLLSRILYGSRVSLTVGVLAVLIAATIGSLVGSLSGFFGKMIDSILMRMVDMILSFPRLFLILLIVALFKPSLLLTILVLGMTGWMGVSRLVRGQVLSLKETDFIRAATAIGQKSGQIIWKHLLPNTSALIIVDSTLRIGHTILVEASLSFLGLGVPPPTPSWGSIISDGRDALIDAWWISTFPGIAIAVTVISFNLFGDFIRGKMGGKRSLA